ncbi:MAG: hypothetical protein ABGW83_07855 [Flavobacteriaceae bacterium]
MEPLEIDQNVNKIKDLLKSDDFEINNTGLDRALTLAEPAVFEKLLSGCGVDDKGKLINENADFNNYIVCCLLVSANSPDLKNLSYLDLSNCKSLKNVDVLSNLNNLITLNLNYCYNLENLDGLANLTNLTTLDIYSNLITNVDVLANLTKITHLTFKGGEKLENMNGLANLTNLEYLDLYETPFNLIWLDAEETGDEDDAEFEDWPLTGDRLSVWFLYMFGSKHIRAYKGGYNFDDIKKDLDVQGFRHELY